jgi:excisionase family DNA binding protein
MAKAPSKTEWISVPDAADLLGCTDVWVIKLIGRGDLDAFRLSGRAWAVSRESVEKNIKEHAERDPSHAGRPRSKLG